MTVTSGVDMASDSSDDADCDRCPICLARMRDQDVGTPESCDHNFCLECIQEWAKVGRAAGRGEVGAGDELQTNLNLTSNYLKLPLT